jgi:hypothetical protein
MKRVLACAILLGALLSGPAKASFIVYLEQSGGNVVATGSGTLNLAALSNGGSNACSPYMLPSMATLSLGRPVPRALDTYLTRIS